jgi:hypothetical protein
MVSAVTSMKSVQRSYLVSTSAMIPCTESSVYSFPIFGYINK